MCKPPGFIHTHTQSASLQVYIHTCTCVHVSRYICICIHTHEYIYMHIHTHTHTHTHTQLSLSLSRSLSLSHTHTHSGLADDGAISVKHRARAIESASLLKVFFIFYFTTKPALLLKEQGVPSSTPCNDFTYSIRH